jgi:hypothetical protein
MTNKFNEQLDKIVRGSRAQLGFGQYSGAAKARLFILAEAASMDQALALSGVDAVLVPAPCRCEAKKSNVLRGCSVATAMEHGGCDFVVLDLDGAIVDVDEDTARLLRIDGSLSDGQLRAIGGLDAAAVIADAGLGETLSFRDLLAVQRLVDFGGRSVILKLTKIYNKSELQALSDRGIAGVAVDSASIDTAALRAAVEALEPKKRVKDKATALVSCPPTAVQAQETEPDVEPDEDE